MNILRDRAKNNFPMVLLTLLSIVQALALELLWGEVHDHPEFYQLSWVAVTGWLRVITTFLGIIVIWLVYATNSMRFRWVPSTTDSIFPFVVGVVQFIMIDNLGSTDLGRWLVSLALIFGLMTWVSQLDLSRARRDEENAEYFKDIPPASKRDFMPALLTVATITICGMIVWQDGDVGWFARVAVVFAFIALVYQMYLTDMFWKRSMFLPDKVQS
jgi:hypothetical protein